MCAWISICCVVILKIGDIGLFTISVIFLLKMMPNYLVRLWCWCRVVHLIHFFDVGQAHLVLARFTFVFWPGSHLFGQVCFVSVEEHKNGKD